MEDIEIAMTDRKWTQASHIMQTTDEMNKLTDMLVSVSG